MRYLKDATGIQKTLIVLFIVTIVLSCLSLIGMMIEKPDRVYTHCERQGSYNSMKPVVLNFSDLSGKGVSVAPNCTTTVNPPMSSGLSLLMNITTVCAGLFIVAAAIAYTKHKKDEPEEEDIDQTPQQ